MAYASRSGHAVTSSTKPRAFGVCDGCNRWFNHYHLKWQFDWAGTSLINKRLLKCSRCIDKPQAQLRAIILPADPTPIQQPRPEPFENDEA